MPNVQMDGVKDTTAGTRAGITAVIGDAPDNITGNHGALVGADKSKDDLGRFVDWTRITDNRLEVDLLRNRQTVPFFGVPKSINVSGLDAQDGLDYQQNLNASPARGVVISRSEDFTQRINLEDVMTNHTNCHMHKIVWTPFFIGAGAQVYRMDSVYAGVPPLAGSAGRRSIPPNFIYFQLISTSNTDILSLILDYEPTIGHEARPFIAGALRNSRVYLRGAFTGAALRTSLISTGTAVIEFIYVIGGGTTSAVTL